MTKITGDMVERVRVAPVGVSAHATRSTDRFVGRHAAMTILAGDEVDARV
jgi:hypothetical protein